MQFLKLFFLFIIPFCGITYGQIIEPIKPRYSYQQKFVAKEFLLNKDTLYIKKPQQVDSLFNVINKAWKKFVVDSLIEKTSLSTITLNNLDAYTYFWTLLSITKQAKQEKEIELHLFKNYMLPSLFKDFQFLNTNRLLTNQNLIWVGSLGNTFSIGTRYYNDKEAFKNLYNLYNDLKILLLSFKDSPKETYNYSMRLLNVLNTYEYELEAKRYYIDNQPDISFTYLITGISNNKFQKAQAISFAKVLINYYQSRHESDKSLAILNSLIFNTTSDELPRGTIKSWYNRVDSLKGNSLYGLAIKKMGGIAYVVSKSSPVVFPESWNIIANESSSSKIKKAKYILVDFWYSACSPCIAEIPELNVLYERLKSRSDIIFISVNTDYSNTKKDELFVKAAIKKFDIQFSVTYDNQWFGRFYAAILPMFRH